MDEDDRIDNDDLLANAQQYSSRFELGQLPTAPKRRLAVLSCMDSRLDLFALLGLEQGEAHIIRNAGGIVTDDVIRSLALSQTMLDTREILVIQHTQCGLNAPSDEVLRERMRKRAGDAPDWPLGAFADVEENVRRSLERIRSSRYLVEPAARGFVYHVESGKLTEVT
jgi:carbonic anhydrase